MVNQIVSLPRPGLTRVWALSWEGDNSRCHPWCWGALHGLLSGFWDQIHLHHLHLFLTRPGRSLSSFPAPDPLPTCSLAPAVLSAWDILSEIPRDLPHQSSNPSPGFSMPGHPISGSLSWPFHLHPARNQYLWSWQSLLVWLLIVCFLMEIKFREVCWLSFSVLHAKCPFAVAVQSPSHIHLFVTPGPQHARLLSFTFSQSLVKAHAHWGNQSWILIGTTDAETVAPLLWPPDAKSWLIGKDPDAGKDWGQEEKGATEDEVVGWHHRLNGHEFEQAPGDGEGQGGLGCCSPWGRKELDTTEQLNWTELT